jgi:hypothetical protein
MSTAATPIDSHPSPSKHWRRPAFIAAAVIVGLAVLGGAAYGLVHFGVQTTTATAEVRAPVRFIVVRVRDGNVHFVPGRGAVTIHSTLRYLLSKPHVKRTTDHGVLTLRAACHHSWLDDCSTNINISVPRGLAIDAETKAGDITAKDVSASRIRVETINGGIHLHLANDPTLILANANEGGISIDLPPARYAVDAQANLGETSVSGITQDDAAPRRIEANAYNGDVNVHANR